jgi:cytochrome b
MTDAAFGDIRVWDPFVRLYHWSQAALIGVAWITADEIKWVHEWAGYILAALLALRLVWGLIGPRHARFSDFVRGPSTVLGYLKDLRRGTAPRYLGHNPAGGAMIVALILSVAATATSGWLLTTDAFWGSDMMQGLHEAFATLILVLVAFHVGGVILESRRHRENLALAMLTGRKRATVPDRSGP